MRFLCFALQSSRVALNFSLFTVFRIGFALYTAGWRNPPPHPVDEWPYIGDMMHIITRIYYKHKYNTNALDVVQYTPLRTPNMARLVGFVEICAANFKILISQTKVHKRRIYI